ncbi:TetR/AcrR family transcriptional regulator [Ligilactobacillus saerimneri]|uniref:TetR/AcrR family transcriptional regulator n=1 Tax=Ligilactobacillus saerimneri TaxID=228229 RepID=UPI001C10A386|nr:TetR/AcrR family transcriptional regulator [Ligilactobacillus saerimneri]MBU5310260.1 TetR/AcrR family transcriptional regulator [Ligilactobacillus saerimneri]
MPSSTFLNLPTPKKDRIIHALVTEFSHHPLADAQVAPIVKEAAIARGAFYQYFTDLNDAYHFVYQLAIQTIHRAIPAPPVAHSAATYTNFTRSFLEQAVASEYFLFIKNHLLFNEQNVSTSVPLDSDAKTWAAATLSHAALREAIATSDSATQALILTRLNTALKHLFSEED